MGIHEEASAGDVMGGRRRKESGIKRAWRHAACAARRLASAARSASRLAAQASARDEGEGFVDVLVKMLIVVIVGAALLAIMRTAVPQLFSDMIDRIRTIFEL